MWHASKPCPSCAQGGSSAALLRMLGLRTDTFAVAAVPALGATAALYAGPLLMALLDHDPAAHQARRTPRQAIAWLMLARAAAASRPLQPAGFAGRA